MNNDIELYNQIGERIKKRRKSLGITQEELAEKTHYSLSFISNIESRTYQTFSIIALNNIAKALNTNIVNLLPQYPIKFDNNEIKCKNCGYQIELPLEIQKLITCFKDISHKDLPLTCPKCNKKIT